MRMNRYRMYSIKIPLGLLFWIGVLVGIIFMNLSKSTLLEDAGLLDEYSLYHMKYMTVDSSALFCYVLWLRVKTVVVLALLATTYLGVPACVGISCWYGLSVGAFAAALMMHYGLKGMVFAVLSVFPQWIIYVPAMMALLGWCMKLNRGIYAQKELSLDGEKKVSFSKRLLQLVGILGMFLLGCLAESFINPGIMGWLLKIF